jgi:hypothetical protein
MTVGFCQFFVGMPVILAMVIPAGYHLRCCSGPALHRPKTKKTGYFKKIVV